VIYNVSAYGSNSQQFDSIRWFSGTRSDSVTVAYCKFDGLTVGSMPYIAGKCRCEELTDAIQLQGSMGNVTHNTITSVFNGFAQGAGNDSTFGSYGEFSYNLINRATDAGIDCSMNGGAGGINMLFLKNDVRRMTTGFSDITGGNAGPYYVLYNLFAYKDGGVKYGQTFTQSQALCLYAHNTFVSDPALPQASLAIRASGGGAMYQYYLNNLFVSTASVPIPVAGLAAGTDSVGTRSGMGVGPCGYCFDATKRDTIGTVGTYGSNWNMNFNRYGLASGTSIGTWLGTPRNLATMRGLFNWEKAGGVGASMPAFTSTSTYNFRLTRAVGNSAYADAARRLTGINTAWGVNRYRTFPGAAGGPDVGAFEFSSKRRRPWWRRWYQHS
jgi:hypothetical protein